MSVVHDVLGLGFSPGQVYWVMASGSDSVFRAMLVSEFGFSSRVLLDV